jgi:hypothetical protein
MRGLRKLKEKALDGELWRTRLGRSYVRFVRQAVEGMTMFWFLDRAFSSNVVELTNKMHS